MNKNALIDTLSVISFLASRVEGQTQATKDIGHAVARSAFLHRPGRPKGAYLFAGPTGVGKTELVKALHELVFDGDPENYARFDMGEYKDGEVAHRRFFVDGGDQDRGTLIDAIVKLNCAGGGILHLDEIEKAPHFRDALLALFDEGRVTDRNGTVHRMDAIYVIATTNLGGASMARQPDFAPYTTLRKIVEAEVRAHFSPEGFARFDNVVVFRRLTAEVQRSQARQRAEVEAAKLAEDMRKALGFELAFLPVTNAAVNCIVEHGYSAEFGLRPLRRAVATLMQDAWVELKQRFVRQEIDPVEVCAGGYQLAWKVVEIPRDERIKSPRRLALVPVDPDLAAQSVSVPGAAGSSKLRLVSVADVVAAPVIDAFASPANSTPYRLAA